jgi:hypothetical protein
MKRLTADEFQDRLQAFNRANRIFGNLTDNNITKSFEAYQAILAEQEREIHMDVRRMQGMTGSDMDGYERPICPDCGEPMGFRPVPPNDEGVVTQLVHLPGTTTCKTVLDTDLTMEQWRMELKKL